MRAADFVTAGVTPVVPVVPDVPAAEVVIIPVLACARIAVTMIALHRALAGARQQNAKEPVREAVRGAKAVLPVRADAAEAAKGAPAAEVPAAEQEPALAETPALTPAGEQEVVRAVIPALTPAGFRVLGLNNKRGIGIW